MSSTDSPDDDHAFFQAIEERFIHLRGAPLLLSPADWQLARKWRQEGIPLTLVLQALEDVFAARTARGATSKVQGLRYCQSAVESLWAEQRELRASGDRRRPKTIDVPARLAQIAAQLETNKRVPTDLAPRVLALQGGPEEVEAALARLDAAMIETAADSLAATERQALERTVEESLTRLQGRIEPAETTVTRERLRHEGLRRRLDLPILSLFES